MTAHALTIHKRTERDGRIIHLAAVCSCGAWSEASTTSALADELLADPGLRLADRLRTAWITHEETARDPLAGLDLPRRGVVPLLLTLTALAGLVGLLVSAGAVL